MKKIKEIRISDIREETYDARLDTEYREAIAESLMVLGYLSDSPLNLSLGTIEQRTEIEEFEAKVLDANQISEIIHLTMYEMRNDFQYGRFRPIANKYINISKEMQKQNAKVDTDKREKQKPICNIYEAHGDMLEMIGLASKTLKKNNMYDESRDMIEKATLSYSYEDAFNVIEEYVELSKERENEEEFE